MDIRAYHDLIRVEALEGRMCHQIADVTVSNPPRRKWVKYFSASEPIRKDWIQDEAFAASRLSMMRIMARRMKAATVVA